MIIMFCFVVCQIARSILDAHSGLQTLSLIDAKLNYIKAWQALPEYGITFFVVRTHGTRKDVSN